MPANEPVARLTILVDATEQWRDRPLYTAILRRARREGLPATAEYGAEAPAEGPDSQATSGAAAGRLPAVGHQPVVVTIVDDRRRVEKFLDSLDDIMHTAAALVDDIDAGRDRSERLGRGAGRGWRRRRRVIDPAEPWETPAPSDLPPSINGVVLRPTCADDVPPGAWAALAEAVGPLELRDIAVAPAGVRRVGSSRTAERVVTQVVVLGFGAASAGLWTLGRVWRVVPYRDLVAVRDEQILLYGRLSLVGTDTRLSVRYNTVCRRVIEPLARIVRQRAAVLGAPLPVLPETGPLPYKWQRLVTGPISRLDPGEPVGVLTGCRRERRTTRMVAAVVVSARELVVMVEPDWLQRYGVDAYHLPRAGLRGASCAGSLLRLLVHDTPIELDVGDELAVDACYALGAVA